MLDKLRNLKETESEMYLRLNEDNILGYFKVQERIIVEKENIEQHLKMFRDFVEESPELFNDQKAKQMIDWLLLASIKLEDL